MLNINFFFNKLAYMNIILHIQYKPAVISNTVYETDLKIIWIVSSRPIVGPENVLVNKKKQLGSSI